MNDPGRARRGGVPAGSAQSVETPVIAAARTHSAPGEEIGVSSVAPSIEVRVVLVGKTGVDVALRLDTGIEVVRVRTPLEAVGELADITRASRPPRSVVIVGPDAGSVAEAGSEAARDFVSALRLLEPAVRVLLAGDPREAGLPFDGAIAPGSSTEAVRAAVRHGATPGVAQSMPEPKPAPASPSTPATSETSKRVETPTAGEIGDESIVRAMVRGQDITSAAVEHLRTKLGDHSVAFVPGAGAAAGSGAANVAWEGRVYGVLRASGVGGARLASAAGWLAAWLRLAEQQSTLREAAFTDPLTGAWNRRYFDRFLSQAIDQARQQRRSVTVLVFDVDDFKRYNDQYGHDAGDEILREIVGLLTSAVRPTDRVCRIGGDEFAVIFHEPDGPREPGSKHPGSIFEIAERFQRQVREHRFPKLSAHAPGPLQISGGLATFPWDGGTPEALLKRADELALSSKRQGKNVITIGTDHSPGM